MNHSDIAALMKGAAPVIRDYLAGAVQPLVDKIAELEGRLNALPKAVDLADIERRIETVAADLKASADTAKAEAKEKRKVALSNLKAGILADCETMVAAKIADLPTPKDGEPGKDADPEVVAALVAADVRQDIDAIRAAVEAFPASLEIPQLPELPDIPALIAEAVAAIPAPENGRDADPDMVASLVKEHVERAVAALPVPKDGQDGAPGKDGTNGADGIPGKDGEPGIPGINGKDGLDAVEFFRGENGHLIAVMSNGTTRDLGQYVGKDGLPGEPGRDGFGFDDFDVVYDGERTFTLKFARAADVKEFVFKAPVVIDRGVFKAEHAYEAGDGVTWGGSFWIAQKDTTDKPESSSSWRLAVKRGRDGKDGSMKPEPPKTPVKVG